MLHIFLIAAILVAFAFVGLAIGVIIKGKFPETHAGHNTEMKKLVITCVKKDNQFCQGRSKPDDKPDECLGCVGAAAID